MVTTAGSTAPAMLATPFWSLARLADAATLTPSDAGLPPNSPARTPPPTAATTATAAVAVRPRRRRRFGRWRWAPPGPAYHPPSPAHPPPGGGAAYGGAGGFGGRIAGGPAGPVWVTGIQAASRGVATGRAGVGVAGSGVTGGGAAVAAVGSSAPSRSAERGDVMR